MTAIEKRVEAVKALRAQATVLDDYMRRMRLGAHPGLEVRPMFWRRGVFAFGYSKQEVEPLPEGMEREFYRFLAQRADEVGREVRHGEALLASVTDPEETR